MPSLTARFVGLGLPLYRPVQRVWRALVKLRATLARVPGRDAGDRRTLPRGRRAYVRVDAGGVGAEWMGQGAAERGLSQPGTGLPGVLYHLHGGGFVRGSAASERPLARRLARATGTHAFSIDYRLAPQHPFPAAVADAVAAYRWLLKMGVPPNRIILSGASAGGCLALSATLSLRDAGDPLPACLVLLSPVTDLTVSGESFKTKARVDFILTRGYAEWAATRYVGLYSARDPLVSPLFANLRGLPPLAIHVGANEVLLSDSTRLAGRAEAAGVAVTLRVWEGLFHVFPAAGFLPESRQAMAEVGAFARRHSVIPPA